MSSLTKVLALKMLENSHTVDAVTSARFMCKTMLKRLLRMGQYLGKTPSEWLQILADVKDAETQVLHIKAVVRRRELKHLATLLKNAIDDKHVESIMAATTHELEDVKKLHMGRFTGPPPRGHPLPWLYTQPSPMRPKKKRPRAPPSIKALYRFAKQRYNYH